MEALINIERFVELTGMSKSWAYKHAADEVGTVRIGRRVLFRMEDVEAFLDRKLAPPAKAQSNPTVDASPDQKRKEIQR